MLPALAAGVAEVEGICVGATEAQARRGPWPMREIVAHLLGAERLGVGRAVRVLEEDDPELASVNWTETVADEPVDYGRSGGPASRAAGADADPVDALTPGQWRRAGYVRPEWGRLTVHRLLSQLARHERGPPC